MQEIAFVSLLKPIDDPRHYHKFAVSMAKPNKYGINIIANDLKKNSSTLNIKFYNYPAAKYPRKSNIGYYGYVIKCLLRLKPRVVIINHPLLLWPVILIKLFIKASIIYDIQENYKLNLLYQEVYPSHKAKIMATVARWFEKSASPWIDHFFLAESIYRDQLDFVDQRYTVLENKSLPLEKRVSRQPGSPTLLFTGNISKISGIDRAMHTYQKLKEQDSTLQFTVVGHCTDPGWLKKLKELDQLDPNVHMHIGTKHTVPYNEVMAAIQQADLAIICYRENPSNMGKIPTKFYEYMAAGLPTLVYRKSHWESLDGPLIIPIDEHEPDLKAISDRVSMININYSRDPFLWNTEAIKLITAMDLVINRN